MDDSRVRYRIEPVTGLDVFYREAGDPTAPTLLLLHGFPTSSHMFRDLIPLLADEFHVVAPDLVGFGYSAAPSVADFDYTFDGLTRVVEQFLRQLDVSSYSMYVQDYGAPVGWRLALHDPGAIEAVVTQNGNAYDAGFFDSWWTRRAVAYGADPSAEHEAAARDAFTLEDIRWQYLTGAPDPAAVSPDAWHHAAERLGRPGVHEAQLALFRDYGRNPALYPDVHAWLRASAVPVLAVWGEGDRIFGPAGATAFAADAVDPEIHLLPGGHFLLETAADRVAALVRDFLRRRRRAAPQASTAV